MGDGDAVESGRFGTVGESCSERRELGDTSDASILLIQIFVNDLALRLSNRGENVGLPLVIAICADT